MSRCRETADLHLTPHFVPLGRGSEPRSEPDNADDARSPNSGLTLLVVAARRIHGRFRVPNLAMAGRLEHLASDARAPAIEEICETILPGRRDLLAAQQCLAAVACCVPCKRASLP